MSPMNKDKNKSRAEEYIEGLVISTTDVGY